jgi:hypothetical protein
LGQDWAVLPQPKQRDGRSRGFRLLPIFRLIGRGVFQQLELGGLCLRFVNDLHHKNWRCHLLLLLATIVTSDVIGVLKSMPKLVEKFSHRL